MKLDQIEESVVSSGSRKLYQGLAKLTPVAVNPTKEQLGKILGTEIEREITYENGDNYSWIFGVEKCQPINSLSFQFLSPMKM